MVFCNSVLATITYNEKKVTILILIDGFLQYLIGITYKERKQSHNPYFNRWFSAIK